MQATAVALQLTNCRGSLRSFTKNQPNFRNELLINSGECRVTRTCCIAVACGRIRDGMQLTTRFRLNPGGSASFLLYSSRALVFIAPPRRTSLLTLYRPVFQARLEAHKMAKESKSADEMKAELEAKMASAAVKKDVCVHRLALAHGSRCTSSGGVNLF